MESEKKEKDEEDLGFVDVMKSLKKMKDEEEDSFKDCKLAIRKNNNDIDDFAKKQGKLIGDDDEQQSMEYFTESDCD
jgi:hypothetical protein